MATIAIYDEDPLDFGDIMPVAEFIRCCKSGAFIDYDGCGEPMRDGKVDRRIMIKPSKIGDIPADATHIQWFNR